MAGEITIRPHTVRDAAYVAYRHSVLYAAEYQLDEEFDRYVLLTLSRFVEAGNAATDRLWVAEVDGEFAGCIGLVGLPDGAAQLRWFLVETEFRRQGIGARLVERVLDFARNQGFQRILLWTLSELAEARRLYSRYGFQLTETQTHDIWGRTRTEERWDLSLQEKR